MNNINHGHDAFDQLAAEGYMEINQVGWGRIAKAPKVTKGPRGRRDLHWFVRCVEMLGAYSVNPTQTRYGIELSRGCDGDEIQFRKLQQQARAQAAPAEGEVERR